MFRARYPCCIVFLLATVLSACRMSSAPPLTLHAPGGPVSVMDFVLTFNTYQLGRTYFQNGRYADAIIQYEQSLKRYDRLDEAARTQLREEYGLSQALIEGELALARTMALEQEQKETR
jgi:hypothetical protein